MLSLRCLIDTQVEMLMDSWIDASGIWQKGLGWYLQNAHFFFSFLWVKISVIQKHVNHIFWFVSTFTVFLSFGCIWPSLLCAGFSVVVVSKGYSPLQWAGFPLQCFSCCGAQPLGSEASVVVANGLSCPTAHGIFPDQGSNLCPLHWKVDS